MMDVAGQACGTKRRTTKSSVHLQKWSVHIACLRLGVVLPDVVLPDVGISGEMTRIAAEHAAKLTNPCQQQEEDGRNKTMFVCQV